MVLESVVVTLFFMPSIIDYIEGDATVWEQKPHEILEKEGQLTSSQD